MRPWRQFAAIVWLEWLFIARDRVSRALLVGVPALQLVLFGATVNLDPHDLPLAIAGETTPGLLAVIAETGRFRVVAADLPAGSAERMVEAGAALVAIELSGPPTGDGPARPLARVIADAADPAAVRPALGALEVAFLKRVIAAEHLGGGPRIDVEWRYNAEGRTAWAVVPGLAGAVIMISMLMLGALTLAREREQGTWESLASAPVGAATTAFGKLAPYLVFGIAQGGIVVLLAWALFDVPVRGSLPVLLVATVLTAAAYLAVGFAVSALARTQMQAMQAAVFLYLPSMLLSGFVFPFEGMPRWARWIGEALPLTHFVRAARDVLLRGADGRAWTEAAWLGLLAAVCTAGAVLAYARRRV